MQEPQPTVKRLTASRILEMLVLVATVAILAALLLPVMQMPVNDGYHRHARSYLYAIVGALFSEYDGIDEFLAAAVDVLPHDPGSRGRPTFWDMPFRAKLDFRPEDGHSPPQLSELPGVFGEQAAGLTQRLTAGVYRERTVGRIVTRTTSWRVTLVPCVLQESLEQRQQGDHIGGTQAFLALVPIARQADESSVPLLSPDARSLAGGVCTYEVALKSSRWARLPTLHTLIGDGRRYAIAVDDAREWELGVAEP